MPEVSVIVPIYNVEPYIHNSLNSILAQTFTDFELILVDDGSTDNCGAICDEYAALDSRIHVIHQVNGGVSKARNAGLKSAVGKYIYFCDGDDIIEKETLNDTVQAMNGYDMVVFNSDEIDVNGSHIRCAPDCQIESEKWNDLEYRSSFLSNDFFCGCLGGFLLGRRLFRKDIIDQNKVFFPQNAIISEDICFIICYLLHSDSLLTIPNIYHHRVMHQTSTFAIHGKEYNFNNNNEISKAILNHIKESTDQVMLPSYFPILHFRVMNNVISHAKRFHPSLSIRDIRSILLSQIKDKDYFLKQAEAFVSSKRLFIKKWNKGRIKAMIIISEWSYYIHGSRFRLLIIRFLLLLEHAIKKLRRPLSRLQQVMQKKNVHSEEKN